MPEFESIYYSQKGNPENPALLFLHGFLGSHKDWDKITVFLSQRYFCICPDLPGHGNSSFLIDSFEKYNDWLARFIDSLKKDSLYLSGYSLGGRLALNFYCSFPEKVTKLILESAHPGLKNEKEKRERYKLDQSRAKQIIQNYPLFLENWYNMPLFAGIKANPNYEQFIHNRQMNNPALLAKALLTFSTAKQKNQKNCLLNSTKPVLLICGDGDQKYKHLFSEMSRQNKSLILSQINNCRHNVHFEKPEQFAEHINTFLS